MSRQAAWGATKHARCEGPSRGQETAQNAARRFALTGNALVLAVDEKSQTQALDRTQPVPPRLPVEFKAGAELARSLA
ncbi:hypothetical protein [Streptomyces sp. NPDC057889]|uniref:hypothetical protein n=1 Tax=unclassified Streptomyces TaxID=2593676 RepID=UPI003678E889